MQWFQCRRLLTNCEGRYFSCGHKDASISCRYGIWLQLFGKLSKTNSRNISFCQPRHEFVHFRIFRDRHPVVRELSPWTLNCLHTLKRTRGFTEKSVLTEIHFWRHASGDWSQLWDTLKLLSPQNCLEKTQERDSGKERDCSGDRAQLILTFSNKEHLWFLDPFFTRLFDCFVRKISWSGQNWCGVESPTPGTLSFLFSLILVAFAAHLDFSLFIWAKIIKAVFVSCKTKRLEKEAPYWPKLREKRIIARFYSIHL